MTTTRTAIRILLGSLAATALLLVATSTVALADNCSSPADCEQTAGYNAALAVSGSVIAITAGLLGSSLAAAGGAVGGVATAAGTVPVEPPIPPAPSVPGAPLVDPWTRAPVVEWQPGKFGPDSQGNGGKPGDVWYGKWMSRSEAQEAIAREAPDAAKQQADVDAAIAHAQEVNRAQGQDPELKAITDRIREAEDRIAQLKAEGRVRELKYWEDYRDTNAAAAARQTAYSQKLDTYYEYANAAQKGADFSMSIASQYGGTTGKAFSAGYTFAKTAAGQLAEGKSFTQSMTQGGKEAIIDLATNTIQDKLHLKFETPLQSVPAGDVVTQVVEGGVKAAAGEGTKATVNSVVSEGIKYPVTKGVELIGRNMP